MINNPGVPEIADEVMGCEYWASLAKEAQGVLREMEKLGEEGQCQFEGGFYELFTKAVERALKKSWARIYGQGQQEEVAEPGAWREEVQGKMLEWVCSKRAKLSGGSGQCRGGGGGGAGAPPRVFQCRRTARST